jgi:hypothetical protein
LATASTDEFAAHTSALSKVASISFQVSADLLFTDMARQIHRVVKYPRYFDVALALARCNAATEPRTLR